MRATAALIVVLAGSLPAQQVDVYRLEIVQRAHADPRFAGSAGVPDSTVASAIVTRGSSRMEYRGAAPSMDPLQRRPGDYMLHDSSGTRHVSPSAKTVTVFDVAAMTSSLGGRTAQMSGMDISISDDSVRVDSLGPGEVIQGQPTARWRTYMTMRMNMSMPGHTVTMVQQHTIEYWFATELPFLDNPVISRPKATEPLTGPFGRLAQRNNEIAGRLPNLLPLRSRTTIRVENPASGPIETSMTAEVINLRKERADRSIFLVPPDYTVQRMTDFTKPPG
jgi:hypothetical protein